MTSNYSSSTTSSSSSSNSSSNTIGVIGSITEALQIIAMKKIYI